MPATHSIQTPINSVGAVSIIAINTTDLTPVFQALNIKPLPPGSIRLSKILNLDDALLASFDPSSLLIMPHGGIAITHAISQALTNADIPLSNQPINKQDPQTTYPEARDIHEARMLAALATAPSPLAVDLLLDQPNRWRANHDQNTPPTDLASAAQLNHLLTPPIVVAVGNANIGKSSLVNALAGEPVAIVSNQAGTTRDHLGVMLNLAGLVVRWVDTPGVDHTVELGDELNLLTPIINSADLIIHAIDANSDPEPLDPRLANQISPDTPTLQITIRADLAPQTITKSTPHPNSIASCSAKTGQGIQELTAAIKNQLLPQSTLSDPRPWRFWDS